jgi:peroxiredoxin Q/BCP
MPGNTRLSTGDAAPDFALPDHKNHIHHLGDYRGDWLVLFFYPRDATPGCTKEACGFQNNYDYFRMTSIHLLGISMDSPESHKRFRDKHQLGFPLLSDRDGSVARAYGSLLGFGPFKLTRRHTFIIDPDGNLSRIYRVVNPAEHAYEITQTLHELTSGLAPAGSTR